MKKQALKSNSNKSRNFKISHTNVCRCVVSALLSLKYNYEVVEC
ncbi:hypothetical protein CAMGR0001_1785 [Campylobacter gracilis RM3268]|uniref:Uncharacterized protein n=1 Tax=Campylobacter gracilis RM3268 TaxID=553220 RepID=C8PK80_9BACT|nr:hypothetical protein CAMGR0001_1785 [Campylobacter gracilis RM3268]